MATTQKIRYSDCDPQGIVFNGNYARYWDDALTDWFEDLGLGDPGMGGHGVDVVAARIEMDFKESASFGDVIETSTTSVCVPGATSDWSSTDARIVVGFDRSKLPSPDPLSVAVIEPESGRDGDGDAAA